MWENILQSFLLNLPFLIIQTTRRNPHSRAQTCTLMKWEMKDGLSIPTGWNSNLSSRPQPYRQPESTCPLVSAQSGLISQNNSQQSLITGPTDLHKVTELSLNGVNLLFKWTAVTNVTPYALKFLQFTPPLQPSWLHSDNVAAFLKDSGYYFSLQRLKSPQAKLNTL